jgi:Lar family restriction alleviation protein
MATNEEVFKTLEERQEAFMEFCLAQGYCGKCPCLNARNNYKNCALAWLEFLYKPELKPCPFCGGTPVMTDNVDLKVLHTYCVKCSCGVRLASATSERVAVEQWNQRA